MNIRIFAIILALSASICSSAQGWDLERCIMYAIDNNIQIKQQALSIEESRLQNQQAKFDYIPSVSASGNYNLSAGRVLDPTTYNYVLNQTVNNVSGSLNLNTQLFAGMQKMHNLKKSELDLKASVQDVEKLKNDIRINVTATYLQIIFNDELIKTSEAQIETIKEQVERTKKLVDAGSVALGDLLELQSQQSTEEYNLVSYESEYQISLLTLTQLLELREVGNFEVSVPNVDNIIDKYPTADVDQIYHNALNMPQIEGAKLRVESADRDVRIAKGKLYPTVSLGASYGSSFSDARKKPHLEGEQLTYGYYPFFRQVIDNASSAIQVGLSIPLFTSLTTRRNVKMARLTQQRAEYQLSLNESALYKEIQQAYTDAISALKQYHSATSSVKSSKETFYYAEQKYNVGATTSVDYNIAKNNYMSAQSKMIQAKYQYVFKSKILDFYLGIPLTLD